MGSNCLFPQSWHESVGGGKKSQRDPAYVGPSRNSQIYQVIHAIRNWKKDINENKFRINRRTNTITNKNKIEKYWNWQATRVLCQIVWRSGRKKYSKHEWLDLEIRVCNSLTTLNNIKLTKTFLWSENIKYQITAVLTRYGARRVRAREYQRVHKKII